MYLALLFRSLQQKISTLSTVGGRCQCSIGVRRQSVRHSGSIWFGDNRRVTDDDAEARILGYHYEHKAQENERNPKAGGTLVIIQGKNDAFRYSWDKSEELDNG